MSDVNLACACGMVRGKISAVDSSIGTRIICCCNDCQAFARYLGQEEAVLDQYGGSDIFQVPMSSLTITEGESQITCLRLSSKGLHRWYASCCNTPIGNTLGASGPFIGVIHSFMDNVQTRDQDLGKSRGYVFSQYAISPVPNDLKATAIKINFRMVTKILEWKLKGFSKPSAFFNNAGAPICPPQILERNTS